MDILINNFPQIFIYKFNTMMTDLEYSFQKCSSMAIYYKENLIECLDSG